MDSHIGLYQLLQVFTSLAEVLIVKHMRLYTFQYVSFQGCHLFCCFDAVTQIFVFYILQICNSFLNDYLVLLITFVVWLFHVLKTVYMRVL